MFSFLSALNHCDDVATAPRSRPRRCERGAVGIGPPATGPGVEPEGGAIIEGVTEGADKLLAAEPYAGTWGGGVADGCVLRAQVGSGDRLRPEGRLYSSKYPLPRPRALVPRALALPRPKDCRDSDDGELADIGPSLEPLRARSTSKLGGASRTSLLA